MNEQFEPATEAQKNKLLWFGCTWDEGISKQQASAALDECRKQFHARDREYYARPATEDQLAAVRSQLEPDEEPNDYADDGVLTYGEAKDLLRDWARDAQRSEMDY